MERETERQRKKQARLPQGADVGKHARSKEPREGGGKGAGERDREREREREVEVWREARGGQIQTVRDRDG